MLYLWWLAYPPLVFGVLLGNPIVVSMALVLAGRGVLGAMALTGALALVMAPLMVEWLATLGNSRGGGVLYSVQEAPMMAIPLLAWLGRER